MLPSFTEFSTNEFAFFFWAQQVKGASVTVVTAADGTADASAPEASVGKTRVLDRSKFHPTPAAAAPASDAADEKKKSVRERLGDKVLVFSDLFTGFYWVFFSVT